MVEAVARLLPGVSATPSRWWRSRHADGLLEYPVYTKPPTWRGLDVPAVLLSGHHGQIAPLAPRRAAAPHGRAPARPARRARPGEPRRARPARCSATWAGCRAGRSAAIGPAAPLWQTDPLCRRPAAPCHRGRGTCTGPPTRRRDDLRAPTHVGDLWHRRESDTRCTPWTPSTPPRCAPTSPTSAPVTRQGARQGHRGQPLPHPGLPGHRHPPPGRRRPRDLHRPQGELRRRRRAHLPGAHPDHRQDRGRHPRRRAPRQALLPARSARQGRQDQGEARRRPGAAEARRYRSLGTPAASRTLVVVSAQSVAGGDGAAGEDPAVGPG